MGKSTKKLKETIPTSKHTKFRVGSHSLIKSLFTVLVSMISYISGGNIVPDAVLPIALYNTDTNARSEYQFKMELDTATTLGCTIEVHFPAANYDE